MWRFWQFWARIGDGAEVDGGAASSNANGTRLLKPDAQSPQQKARSIGPGHSKTGAGKVQLLEG